MNYFEKNYEIIKKFNKDFAKNLKNVKECENIEVVDKNNFLIKLGAKNILAYPKGKEKEAVNNVISKNKFYNNEITIQVGVGSGYMLSQLLKSSDKNHLILLVEPILALLKYAFENYDFSKYINNGKLLIVTKKEDISGLLAVLEAQRVIQQWHMFSENYTALLPNYYAEISKLTSDLINQIMCNVGTVMGAGAIIAENDIKNLPYVIKHRGVNELKDLFKGKPAIVILSAPTVTKLLPQLLDEKIREGLIIIAVAQMLRPLLAFGIKPDFICTVDYGIVNYEHFDNLWYVKDVPLVCLNRTYAPILEKWQGAKFITTGFNPASKDNVVELLNKKGQLDQGGSVGHVALGLAIHLGCNPIIHIGFDCAYDLGLSHTPLVDANGKINLHEDGSLEWDVTDPNSTLKDKPHQMGNIVYLEGYFGKPVPTNMGLASFVTAIETIFKSYPDIKFINACEGGAKKKYCEQMSLKKALTFVKGKINKTVLDKYLSLLPDYEEDIKEAKRRLHLEIELFDKEIEYCTKAINALKGMQKADNKTLKKLLDENQKWANLAQEIAKESNLLQLHIYKTSREIQMRELKVNGKTAHLMKDKDDLKTRIKRSKLILSEAKKSAIKLKDIYKEVLDQLEEKEIIFETDIASNKKYKQVLKKSNIEKGIFNYLPKDSVKSLEPEINIKPETWDKLIENGNWARPLLEAQYLINKYFGKTCNNELALWIKYLRQCLVMKQKTIDEGLNRPDLTDLIEYNKLIDKSRETGKNKNFKESLKCLRKAYKLFPDKLEVLWGLASNYYQLGMINQAIKIFNKLCSKQPENKRFKFELGQVWLLKDIEKGIKLIDQVMLETNDFVSFNLRLAEISIGTKNFAKAKEYIDKYLEVYPHSIEGKELKELIEKKLK